MKKQLILSMILLTTSSTALAARVDVYGGPQGAQTIHACPSPMQYTDYANTPAAAMIVRNKLEQLGYGSFYGKGGSSKGNITTAVKRFQQDMALPDSGVVNQRTALMLAYYTATDPHTARCLQLAMR